MVFNVMYVVVVLAPKSFVFDAKFVMIMIYVRDVLKEMGMNITNLLLWRMYEMGGREEEGEGGLFGC